MHIPDGFFNGATSAGAALVAAGGLGGALKRAGHALKERLVPFAGLTAAFVFALQMLNFPVAAFASGHVIGGALAAILLGPAMGIVTLSVVVVVQALLFADGGITAVGLNLVNMALVAVLVAWLVFRLAVRLLPRRRASVPVAAMLASWVSVVAASVGFSIEYALGGHGGVDPVTVLSAMVGIHALIGVGEGLITATALTAVVSLRPDLVDGIDAGALRRDGRTVPPRAAGVFVAVGIAVAFGLVVLVAPFADSSPDGLERVATDTGLIGSAVEHPLDGPLAGYAVRGVGDSPLGTALAGLLGVGVTFAGGMMAVGIARRRRSRGESVSR